MKDRYFILLGILALVLAFLICFLALSLVSAQNISEENVTKTQEGNTTTFAVQNGTCSIMVLNFLKDANFQMQEEIELKDKEIAELKGYKRVGQVAIGLAILSVAWSSYLIYFNKKEGNNGRKT